MLAPYACTLNPAYGAVTGDLTYRVRGNQDQAGRGHCVSAYPRLDYRGGQDRVLPPVGLRGGDLGQKGGRSPSCGLSGRDN